MFYLKMWKNKYNKNIVVNKLYFKARKLIWILYYGMQLI